MIKRMLFDPTVATEISVEESRPGDRRDGLVYDYDDRTVLAINVAIATGRPLLVRGPSGCGKSSLARHVARVQGWRYYERVISSRTQAQDLLWELDHLRRLHDAQTGRLAIGLAEYIRPGVLWRAFDPASAARQDNRFHTELGHSIPEPGPGATRAVILLDEIDKADPDVPNNLLVPLGSLQFEVEDAQVVVEVFPSCEPLVVVTTNDERELPGAFLRRCVELEILQPSKERLVRIGQKHFPAISLNDLDDIACRIFEAVDEQAKPSTAEYLDLVRAWHRLGESFDPKIWEDVLRVAVHKPGRFSSRDV